MDIAALFGGPGWRAKTPDCPACRQRKPVLRSRHGDGWFCWEKRGGCGLNFTDDDVNYAAVLETKAAMEPVQ